MFGCNPLNLVHSSLILCLSCGIAPNWPTLNGARRVKLANFVGREAAT